MTTPPTARRRPAPVAQRSPTSHPPHFRARTSAPPTPLPAAVCIPVALRHLCGRCAPEHSPSCHPPFTHRFSFGGPPAAQGEGLRRRWRNRPPPCLHLRPARRRRLLPPRWVGLWARARRWGAARGRRCSRTYYFFCAFSFCFCFFCVLLCFRCWLCWFSRLARCPSRTGRLWAGVRVAHTGAAGKGSHSGCCGHAVGGTTWLTVVPPVWWCGGVGVPHPFGDGLGDGSCACVCVDVFSRTVTCAPSWPLPLSMYVPWDGFFLNSEGAPQNAFWLHSRARAYSPCFRH